MDLIMIRRINLRKKYGMKAAKRASSTCPAGAPRRRPVACYRHARSRRDKLPWQARKAAPSVAGRAFGGTRRDIGHPRRTAVVRVGEGAGPAGRGDGRDGAEGAVCWLDLQ